MQYSQTWLESHCLQHQPLYNNTHGPNGFNGLCTKCPDYNNNVVITAHFSGTKGVVVNKFDCISVTMSTEYRMYGFGNLYKRNRCMDISDKRINTTKVIILCVHVHMHTL